MRKIPKEIEDQISGQSKMYATGEGPTIDRLIAEGSLSFNDLQNCCEVDFGEGAEFGYSLSLTRIGELEKENERLKVLLEKEYKTMGRIYFEKYGFPDSLAREKAEQSWNVFKTENQL